MGGGSGGSSAPTEQTVYSESLPPYVEPYFKRLLQRTEGSLYKTIHLMVDKD